MVSRNTRRFAKAFESAADDRDLAFFLAVPLTGVVGGVVAAEVSEWGVSQVLGSTSGTRGKTAVGTGKLVTGGLLGGAADMVGLDNYGGQALAVMGIGAMMAGGADLFGVINSSGVIPDVLSPAGGRTRSTSRRRLKQANTQRANTGNAGASNTQRSSSMSANRGSTPTAYS